MFAIVMRIKFACDFFFAADYGGYYDLWFGIKNHKTGNYFGNLGYSSYC